MGTYNGTERKHGSEKRNQPQDCPHLVPKRRHLSTNTDALEQPLFAQCVEQVYSATARLVTTSYGGGGNRTRVGALAYQALSARDPFAPADRLSSFADNLSPLRSSRYASAPDSRPRNTWSHRREPKKRQKIGRPRVGRNISPRRPPHLWIRWLGSRRN